MITYEITEVESEPGRSISEVAWLAANIYKDTAPDLLTIAIRASTKRKKGHRIVSIKEMPDEA